MKTLVKTILLIFALVSLVMGQVRLTWDPNDPVGLVGYNVYRSTTSGVYGTPLNAAPPLTLNAYTDSSAPAGVSLFYTVTAVGMEGELESERSNEVSALIQPQQPGQIILEAESFFTKAGTCGANLGDRGDGVGLGYENICSTYEETSVMLTAGAYRADIIARGEDGPPGSWPIMALSIDGVIISQVAVSAAAYAIYPFSVNVTGGTHTVRIELINDFYDPANGIDVNLIVDKIIFTPISDTQPPAVTSFTMFGSSSVLAVPITSFVATDNTIVTGYFVSETSAVPAADAQGWTGGPPAVFNFLAVGSRTLYGWAKDAAGNISASKTATTVITLPSPSTPPPDIIAPTIMFVTTATSVTINSNDIVIRVAPRDNVGVVRVEMFKNEQINPISIAAEARLPATTNMRWQATSIPRGTYTLTVYAHDAAGNKSMPASLTVIRK